MILRFKVSIIVFRSDLTLTLLVELVVRTTHLMLAVEDSVASMNREGIGKALIFGNFAIRAS